MGSAYSKATRKDISTEDLLEKFKSVYKILNKILIHPNSDWKTKIYVNSALSYFIKANDVIPEEQLNKEGYVDDYYISLLILRDLNIYRSELIKNIFYSYIIEDVNEFLDNEIEYCESILGNKIVAIKKMSAFNSLDKFDIANKNVDERISEKLDIRSRLIGMIAFFHNELLQRNNITYKVGLLKQLSETEDFFDIQRVCVKYNISDPVISEIDEINNINGIFFNYEDKLKKVEYDDSKSKELIKYSLPIFKTLCNIISDPKCNDFEKHEINCALAYFGLIDDVLPDSLKGAIGFIDDLFMGSFVLFDLLEKDNKLVLRNLFSNFSSDDIHFVFENSFEVVEQNIGKIINLLGLKGLLSYYELYFSKQHNHRYVEQIINDRLKAILVDLSYMYFEKKDIINKRLEPPRIEIIIKSRMNQKEKDKLNKLIEISSELSYNRNISEENSKRNKEELELLLLKQKILCD